MAEKKTGTYAELQAIMAKDPEVKIQVEQAQQQFAQNKYDDFVLANPKVSEDVLGVARRRFGLSKTSAADIQVGKEVKSQEMKKSAETQRNLRNLRGRADVVMGGFIDYIDRAHQIHGQKPGPLTGAIGTIIDPLKINEFAEAFDGMNPEYSAAVARAAIPGVRALRMVDVFSKGKPSKWSTVDSGIRNASATQKMALAGYFAANPDKITDEAGKKIDWTTNPREWNNMVKHWSDKFQKEYEDGWYFTVYQKNPDLLEPEKVMEIEEGLQAELQGREK